ncbi:hypothetical protein Pmani_012428 [Petrolisthes manimaculis]|uniref:TIR domain-containing protein n=1 Tax=Petrolisthes manimaculis TaxID=1843537 RepID=A0AAE1UAI0_9EUCA|nr:hypothetical protein Pmani_012428 [Petrolisthes manimaculis]
MVTVTASSACRRLSWRWQWFDAVNEVPVTLTYSHGCAMVDTPHMYGYVGGCMGAGKPSSKVCFPSIRYVYFLSCPLLDQPFSEVLEEIGVDASEVITISFKNVDQRTGLTLRPDHLEGLPALLNLEFDRNNFTKIPTNLLEATPSLQFFGLTENTLPEIPDTWFDTTPNLTTLNLRNNGITSLPENLLADLPYLTSLSLYNNELSEIQPQLLQKVSNLSYLVLAYNKITHLPSSSFAHLTNLTQLDLTSNNIKELPEDLLYNCPNLTMFIITGNQLTSLPSFLFKRNTKLTEKHFPLSSQTNLVDLRLGDNQITSMPSALTVFFPNMARLDLSHNNIDYVDQSDLSFTSESIALSLQNNKIKTLALGDPEATQSVKKVELRLSGNPLVCDCHLYHLAKLMQKQRKTPSVMSPFDHNRLHGNSIYTTGNDGLTVYDAQSVTCIQGDGNNEIKVLDIDASALTCPALDCVAPCTCFTRPSDHMFIFDCSHRGLQKPPHLALFTALHITTNSSFTYINVPNNVTILQPSTTENTVSYLQPTTTDNPPRLLLEYKILVNLTDNDISFVNESFFPASLKVLDMRRNQLTSLPVSFLSFLNTTNATLSLGGNPWECNCALLPLFSFLRDPARNVTDAPNMVCRDLEMSLVKVLEENLCPVIQQPMVIVTIASTTVFLFLFFILGTVSVYRYQQDIKVWLFTHRLCLWAVAEEEEDANKKYDAFISYSNKDEEFVNSVLVPGLESGDPKYRVCLHYRDWTPGEYIQNQIDQSIEASRRTIVVLSNNFIENVWGQIEFKTAHSKALKDKTNRIIVIVFGEIPPEAQMDEELKLYLSTRTYLQWRDPKFWEKLRYAMPHPQQFVHRKHRPQQKTEKLELQGNSIQTV